METNATIRLRIEGMSCGGCVARVERALQSVEGVVSARVNLTAQAAWVEVGDRPATVVDLVRAIREAGYDAEAARPGDAGITRVDREHEVQLRRQRQALVQAVAMAVPIMGVHWIAPVLQSSEHGGHVWPHAVLALQDPNGRA